MSRRPVRPLSTVPLIVWSALAFLCLDAHGAGSDWTRGGACAPAWIVNGSAVWVVSPICNGRTMVFAAGTGYETGQKKSVTGFRVSAAGRRAVADWKSDWTVYSDGALPSVRLIDRVRFATADGGRHWRPVRATETATTTDYIPDDPDHGTMVTTTGPDALSLKGCVWENWTVTRRRAGPGKPWPAHGRVFGNVCVPRRVAQVNGTLP